MSIAASELMKTPLNAAHRILNAKMVDFGGWDMPVQYPAGIIAEHEAVRTKAGLFDVSHMGEIRVKGPGALALVEHLTPNAVSKLVIGQVHYTAFLYENGTFVDDLLVYREGEQEFLLVVNAGNSELLVVALMDGRETHVFGRRTLPEMDLASLACAIQNLWLAGSRRRLGYGLIMFEPQALADLLGMPPGSKPLAVLCLGPVTAFYDAPMLVQQGWVEPRPLSELLFETSGARHESTTSRSWGVPVSLVLSTCAGGALDALLGESKGWHPLVAFGRMAERIEQRFNPAGRGWRSHGVSAWCLAVLPLTLSVWLLSQISGLGWALEIIALYAALGLKSLGEHAMPVAQALRLGDLRLARERVGYMVSRNTAQLDATGVARAGTESVLENGSDAVFAALFWFVLAGAPGVVQR